MSVVDRIKEEMAKRNMSQNRLAKAAQISQSGLSSILNGDVSPKENTLQAIAQALNMPLYELMDRNPTDEISPFRDLQNAHVELNPEAQIMLRNYHKLNPENRIRASAFLEGLLSSQEK